MEQINARNKRRFLPLLILAMSLSFSPINAAAQALIFSNECDTNYIESYTEELTTRLFSSMTFARMTFRDANLDMNLVYAINSKVSFGAGFNYSFFGVNIGFSPFNGLRSDSKYGKTKSFDFRMNLYGRSLLLDVYLMSNQGFYLDNPESILSNWTDPDTYPLRPDMNLFSTGIVLQYLFNNKKFSMRATFVQNEWQKKSAGSFIVGGDVFYAHLHGDSSFIPTNISDPEFMNGYKFNHSASLNLGVNGGYSHTFVVKQHFFGALGLSVGPQFSYSTLSSQQEDQPDKAGATFGLNGLLRAGIGYNSRRMYIGIFFINENLAHQLASSKAYSLLSSGIFKLNFAWRFTLKKPIKFLNPRYWKKKQADDSDD